jgi:hypothetical protein
VSLVPDLRETKTAGTTRLSLCMTFGIAFTSSCTSTYALSMMLCYIMHMLPQACDSNI